MCSDQRTPDDVLYLDRQQLRLISDPIRRKILQRLCDGPMSATELKAAIEDAPSNVHYHVDRLRDAGLIRLVRSAPRRGATEKYYRAVARHYTMAPELLAEIPGDRSLDEDMLGVVRGLLEEAYGDLARGLAAGLVGEGDDVEVPVINGGRLRFSRERAARLRRALVDWLRDCARAHDPDGEVEFSCLSLMLPVDLGRDQRRPSGSGDEDGGGSGRADAGRDSGPGERGPR